MSMELIVFLSRDHLPSRDAWQRAITDNGYDLRLDDADPVSHTGFWPAKLGSVDCGFEYFFEPVVQEEEPEEILAAIGTRGYRATFVWHGSIDDCRAAIVAAGILVKVADGVLLDSASGELADGENALALFENQEVAERERKMQQAIRKWGSITHRRCPECGAPCPEYRATCFVCNYQLGRA
jgi:hypothetical protein